MIATVAGTGVAGFSGDGTLATGATINVPASVVLDVAGNLYIADSGNNRVRKVEANTGVITTVAGTTSQSISGDGGPATAAGLYGPYTLALDGPGNLYIADVFHNRVRMISASQAVLNFQPMRIGRVATAQQQTIENDGNATLNVQLLQAVSDSVIDGTTTTCIGALALAPLNSCVIGASFAPTHLGAPTIGVVSLCSNATNTPAKLNLVGNVLNQDPAVVTLAVSANPVQTGDSIYFTVNVASPGVIPTGQVTLLDGTNPLAVVNLQTGGVATFTVSNLTGGQHSITASYSGDTNNTAASSLPLIETVKDITAPTLTTVVASANPLLAGATVNLTATVAVANAGSGSGTISGPVTFTDGTTIIGAGTVSAGVASISVATLAAGSHSIVATYAGISNFATSSSAPLMLNVQPGTTTTLLASSLNPAAGGASILLTASVISKSRAGLWKPFNSVINAVMFRTSIARELVIMARTARPQLQTRRQQIRLMRSCDRN